MNYIWEKQKVTPSQLIETFSDMTEDADRKTDDQKASSIRMTLLALKERRYVKKVGQSGSYIYYGAAITKDEYFKKYELPVLSMVTNRPIPELELYLLDLRRGIEDEGASAFGQMKTSHFRKEGFLYRYCYNNSLNPLVCPDGKVRARLTDSEIRFMVCIWELDQMDEPITAETIDMAIRRYIDKPMQKNNIRSHLYEMEGKKYIKSRRSSYQRGTYMEYEVLIPREEYIEQVYQPAWEMLWKRKMPYYTKSEKRCEKANEKEQAASLSVIDRLKSEMTIGAYPDGTPIPLLGDRQALLMRIIWDLNRNTPDVPLDRTVLMVQTAECGASYKKASLHSLKRTLEAKRYLSGLRANLKPTISEEQYFEIAVKPYYLYIWEIELDYKTCRTGTRPDFETASQLGKMHLQINPSILMHIIWRYTDQTGKHDLIAPKVRNLLELLYDINLSAQAVAATLDRLVKQGLLYKNNEIKNTNTIYLPTMTEQEYFDKIEIPYAKAVWGIQLSLPTDTKLDMISANKNLGGGGRKNNLAN